MASRIVNEEIMITSHQRGNEIEYRKKIGWVYMDGTTIKEERNCTKCRKPPIDGKDACMGHIKGAVSVCCGHGKKEAILM